MHAIFNNVPTYVHYVRSKYTYQKMVARMEMKTHQNDR